MFFIGIFGTDSKAVSAGSLAPLRCPICNETVSMYLSHSYQYFHAFFIPVIKFGNTYLATCPSCTSVFTLTSEKGQAIQHRKSVEITSTDLRCMHDNHTQRPIFCSACGTVQPKQNLFCGHCGIAMHR